MAPGAIDLLPQIRHLRREAQLKVMLLVTERYTKTVAKPADDHATLRHALLPEKVVWHTLRVALHNGVDTMLPESLLGKRFWALILPKV